MNITTPATLDLTLRRVALTSGEELSPETGIYSLEARFTAPESTGDTLLYDPPFPIATIDLQGLRAFSNHPEGYGQHLCAMLFADPRVGEAWRRARAGAEVAHAVLRLCLQLDPTDDLLNMVRWETIIDPDGEEALALSERVLVSRVLATNDMRPVWLATEPDLKAVIVVAAPTDLHKFGLDDIAAETEVASARAGLGDET
ncbi:MAG: hypothetical protein HGA19_16795, partial [Oscillochloris sp.]|nr:hypothetical protein [Oscillochloris sp.]